MAHPVHHPSQPDRQYLLLAYRDENRWRALSAVERAAFENACLSAEQELQQSGYLFAVQDRHPTITVYVMNGKLFLNEGPFVPAKGPLVELFLIQARDLNEAIQIAAKMPQAYSGSIEVRPLLALDQP